MKVVRLLGILFVVFVLMVGCRVGEDKVETDGSNSQTEKSEIKSELIIPALPDGWDFGSGDDVTNHFKQIVRIDEDNLEEYQPESFQDFGKLTPGWNSMILIDNVFPGFEEECPNSDISFSALPNDWIVHADYVLNLGTENWENKHLTFSINPLKGTFEESLLQIGVTDGKYIWNDINPYSGTQYIQCQKVDDTIIWAEEHSDFRLVWRHHHFRINNKKLFLLENGGLNKLYYYNFSLINPWTGKTIWTIGAGVLQGFYCVKSNDLVLIQQCDYYSRTYQYSEPPPPSKYYTFNTKTLAVEQVFEDYSPLEIISNGDILFAYDGKNLLKLNERFDGIEESFQIGEGFKMFGDDKKIANNFSGDFFLAEKFEEPDTPIFLINSETGEKKLLDYTDVQIINHTLITTNESTIQALNPSTLEAIWWINLEQEDLGKNPRVIWCDFRGVLVMSDTKLACYVSD